MAIHSRVLAWKILLTEEPGGHIPWGCKETDSTQHTNMYAGLIIANHRIDSCYSVVVLID